MTKPIPFANLDRIQDHITTFNHTSTYPESIDTAITAYRPGINLFAQLVQQSDTSADLLDRIRSREIPSAARMTLLKMFRRCVSPVCDTEMSKKLRVATSVLVDAYGDTFKDIATLKAQFKPPMTEISVQALCLLLAENDNRGQTGYALTGVFFKWFEENPRFAGLEILGPRGAGRDIELSSELTGFPNGYPCDLIIKSKADASVKAVGFARYDSTRGGSQSDDRTGGNANKVEKAGIYQTATGTQFRILFLSDGPGLLHRDTLEESKRLDGCLNGAVRVTTLKLAESRVTLPWIMGVKE